jgi:hypothetical protein
MDIPEEDPKEVIPEEVTKGDINYRTQITLHHHPQIHPRESIIRAIQASGQILTMPHKSNCMETRSGKLPKQIGNMLP